MVFESSFENSVGSCFAEFLQFRPVSSNTPSPQINRWLHLCFMSTSLFNLFVASDFSIFLSILLNVLPISAPSYSVYESYLFNWVFCLNVVYSFLYLDFDFMFFFHAVLLLFFLLLVAYFRHLSFNVITKEAIPSQNMTNPIDFLLCTILLRYKFKILFNSYFL